MHNAITVRPSPGHCLAPEPGVYVGVEHADYDNWVWTRQSELKRILESPAHYREAVRSPRVETEAMAMGTAIHTLVLEPEKFDARFVGCDSDQKSWVRTGEKSHDEKGRRYLTNAGMLVANACAEAVCVRIQEPLYRLTTMREVAVVGLVEPDTYAKIRVDALVEIPEANAVGVLEIKTARDASREAFAKSAAEFLYHFQEAFYRRVLLSAGFTIGWYQFVVVQTTPPHIAVCYTLDAEAVELGDKMVSRAVGKYVLCAAANRWDGPEDAEISLPPWYVRRAQQELER